MNGKASQEVTQVSDRITDRWIKVLSLFAMITIPLVGTIGYQNDSKQQSIIDVQKATNDTLKEVVKTLNIFNVALESHKGKISRNKEDIEDIVIKVNGNTQEINKLKGFK